MPGGRAEGVGGAQAYPIQTEQLYLDSVLLYLMLVFL